MPSVAIIECLTIHTEVMGGAAALFHEKGYDVYMFFNYSDPWHMIDVYKEYYPWLKGVHSWHELFTMLDTFDIVMLNTSDEWVRVSRRYRKQIEELNNAEKLGVIHHETLYLSTYPQYKRYIGLTPAYGSNKWFLPMYIKPVLPSMDTVSTLTTSSTLPSLVCVGSLNSKDCEDIGRYIKVGGHVVNYVRYAATELMELYGSNFTCYDNMNGQDLMKSLTTTIGDGRGFMWFPIVQTTTYATSKFTGSITLGVHVNAILVMPRVLRDMYNMDPEAVITYDTTITESDTLSELQNAMCNPEPYINAMYKWKQKQWNINMQNWDQCILSATHN
jgi:hypothetical protein